MNSVIKDRIQKIEEGIVPEGYQDTKVGIIPEDWEVNKMGEISQLFNGFAFKSKDAKKDGIKWLKIANVGMGYIKWEEESYLPYEFKEKYKEYLLTKDDLVMALTRPILGDKLKLAKIRAEDEGSLLNQRVGKIIPIKDMSSNRYLEYLLTYNRTIYDIEVTIFGTDPPNMSKVQFESIFVRVPPLQEQEKIADILSTWDKAIENIEKLIKEKEIQKKGLMQQLLTGETRLPGFSGEWKEVKLGEVVTRAKGKAVVKKDNGRYPILGIEALSKNEFVEFTDDDRVLSKKTDILLLWDGAAAGSIFTDVEGSVGSTFMRLRPKGVSSIFIREYMRKDEWYIMNIREGSGIPHIPRDFLDYYRVNLPPHPEQKAIAEILSTADKEIELLNKLLTNKKEEKKGLMQLLLTGIVRV